MEPHDGADVVLLRIHHLFVVGLHQQGQGHPVRAQGGLHHIGDIVLVLLLIEIGQVLAGVLLMLGQVVVGPVRHAPQLPPAEGEQILKVRSGLGVETQLLGLVIPQPQILLLDVQALQPVVAVRPPILEPLQIRVRLAEELQLHLLELPDAENEIARGDLVAEGLADLAHAEGQLPAGGPLDGGEVDKNALGGLRPQVHLVGGVLRDALVGLEHQVELADVGEVTLAAARAGHLVVPDECHQLLLGHGLHVHIHAVLLHIALHQLVRPVAHLAGLAVNQRIVEGGYVAAGHPHLGIHQNGGVQSHVVGILLDEFLPPGPLDIVLHLHAQGTVVPAVGKAAIDLTAGEYESPVLTQGHDLLHGLLGVFHAPFSFTAARTEKTPRAGFRLRANNQSVVPPEFAPG